MGVMVVVEINAQVVVEVVSVIMVILAKVESEVQH